MNRISIIIFLLFLLIGSVCSCYPLYNNSEQIIESSPPDNDGIVADSEPYVKQTFDLETVYQHVFVNHSQKLTEQEAEKLCVDTSNGEAIICFLYNSDISSDFSIELKDYYLVSGVSTALKGANNKYFTVVNTYANLAAQCDIVDDYHEIYLDVMFEHLTFVTCDRIPGMQDMVYEIGYICSNSDDKKYELRSDGHIYYMEQDKCYKSEQKIDSAYLTSMLFSSYRYMLNCDDHQESLHYWNEEVLGGGEMCVFDKKGELPVIDNVAYDRLGNSWSYIQDRYLSQHGLIGVYANRVIAYPNAAENSLLNYPDY